MFSEYYILKVVSCRAKTDIIAEYGGPLQKRPAPKFDVLAQMRKKEIGVVDSLLF